MGSGSPGFEALHVGRYGLVVGFPTLGLAGATGAMLVAGAGLVTFGRKRPNRRH
ncbi:hypothetical protein HEP84_57470 [Streptomyces sp. RLB1-33]|nr:hypothetical protein [Streptomyces sp. RLB1-33]